MTNPTSRQQNLDKSLVVSHSFSPDPCIFLIITISRDSNFDYKSHSTHSIDQQVSGERNLLTNSQGTV